MENVLPYGTTAEIVGRNDGDESKGANDGGLWWKIRLLDGREGWVAHRHNAPDNTLLVNAPAVTDVPVGGTGRGGLVYTEAPTGSEPDPAGSEPVPTAGRLYARLGVAAGGLGDRLRAWPSLSATELSSSVRADVWYAVRHLYAHTGLGDLWLEVAPHSAIPSGPRHGPGGLGAAGAHGAGGVGDVRPCRPRPVLCDCVRG